MNKEQRQLALDFKNAFSTVGGQRLLAHLETLCGGHVNQDNFVAESATMTAYNLGKNRVYRHILSMVTCDLGALNRGQDCIIETEESGE